MWRDDHVRKLPEFAIRLNRFRVGDINSDAREMSAFDRTDQCVLINHAAAADADEVASFGQQ